jgi:hypothetical protein
LKFLLNDVDVDGFKLKYDNLRKEKKGDDLARGFLSIIKELTREVVVKGTIAYGSKLIGLPDF